MENASQVFPYVVPCPLIWQFRHSGILSQKTLCLQMHGKKVESLLGEHREQQFSGFSLCFWQALMT
jgi:hypothetical protein